MVWEVGMKLRVSLSYLRVMVIAVALGLLAKTAGPGSSRAGIESRTTELIEALVRIRAGLDLYRAEHEDRLPSTSSSDEFKKALTQRNGQYGPYIKEIPDNPFNSLDTVRFDGQPAGNNTAGWRLDMNTGIFQADNDPAYSAL
jgi:Tfp pilus assembly protein PilE